MNTYVMLIKLLPGALVAPNPVETLNREVSDRIKRQCTGVRWLANYAISGRGDYLDVFETPDGDTATKVALLIRSFARTTAELWTATPWDRFVEMARCLGGSPRWHGNPPIDAANQGRLERADARQRRERDGEIYSRIVVPADRRQLR